MVAVMMCEPRECDQSLLSAWLKDCPEIRIVGGDGKKLVLYVPIDFDAAIAALGT